MYGSVGKKSTNILSRRPVESVGEEDSREVPPAIITAPAVPVLEFYSDDDEDGDEDESTEDIQLGQPEADFAYKTPPDLRNLTFLFLQTQQKVIKFLKQ